MLLNEERGKKNYFIFLNLAETNTFKSQKNISK